MLPRLSALLVKARPALESVFPPRSGAAATDAHPACVLFFSVSSGKSRAHVVIARGGTLAQAWQQGATMLQKWCESTGSQPAYLRVDGVTQIQAMTWAELKRTFQQTKRNYYRFGLAFDADFQVAALEQELNANAVLYHSDHGVVTPNASNLAAYGRHRFGTALEWPQDDNQTVWRFKTRAIFVDAESVHPIEPDGRNSGYRVVSDWGPARVRATIAASTGYLARQIKPDGAYHYGWFPCFDRLIPAYNALRHASSTYALLEGWELTQDAGQQQAIERALAYLTQTLIRPLALPDGAQAAFLVDQGDEIKLGGNAVCLLALSKYTEITGDQQYLPLMEQLAVGILFMQDTQTGAFVHVLNYPDLSLKARHRIIYYDGEAAFGLMRLYGLTRDARWLAAVERAFDHFIKADHWKAHDHWLSYCVNELTLYRPDERYYRFGLDNVRDHLDFVLNRITTYPTLLELMMAAQRMIQRMQADPAMAHLLEGFDLETFHRALEHRARYLLNGFFWPELAMFFKNPARILNGFFIRHHSFRVRIDDVEHYLSGYVAYLKYLNNKFFPVEKNKIDHPNPKNSIIDLSVMPEKPKVFFCNLRFGKQLTGVEHSALKRANLFVDHLGIVPVMLTYTLDLHFFRHWTHLVDVGVIRENVHVLNMYDDLMEGYTGSSLPPTSLSFDSSWSITTNAVTEGVHQQLRDADGRLKMYVVWQDTARLKIDWINFFQNGRKIRREKYNRYGQLAIVQELGKGDIVIREDIFNPKGGLKLIRLFEPDGHKIKSIDWFLDDENEKLSFSSEKELAQNWLARRFSEKGNVFVVDKNRVWAEPLSQLSKQIPLRLISVIHSVHVGFPNDDFQTGRLNASYRDILIGKIPVDFCVVLTEWQKLDIENRFKGFSYQLVCIPHAQDTPKKSINFDARDLDMLVAFVRLVPEKRIEDMVRIMALLIKAFPKKRLHIYGEGEERSRIQSLIIELGLQNNVFLEGYTENTKAIFRRAAVSLLTSRVEGFSLTVLESLSLGCPVCAYDIRYGPSSMISHDYNGWLIPPGSVEKAADVLISVFKKENFLKEISVNALASAKQWEPSAISGLWRKLLQDYQ